MWDLWQQAYRLRPFGDEQLLLARIASLIVIVIARNGAKFDDVLKASDSILKVFMPPDWIGQEPETPQPIKIDTEGIAAFEQLAAKVFG